MADLKLTKTAKFGKYEAELVQGAFPAPRFHAAFVAIGKTQLSSGDFDEDTIPLMAFVESWTAPGDPQDIKSWQAFEYISEYAPLRRAILEIVNKRFEQAEADDLPN